MNHALLYFVAKCYIKWNHFMGLGGGHISPFLRQVLFPLSMYKNRNNHNMWTRDMDELHFLAMYGHISIYVKDVIYVKKWKLAKKKWWCKLTWTIHMIAPQITFSSSHLFLKYEQHWNIIINQTRIVQEQRLLPMMADTRHKHIIMTDHI